MPFNPFTALTSKIFGGLSLGLLIVVAVLWLRVEHWHNSSDRWQNATKKAEIAIEAMKRASKANADLAIAQVKATEARAAAQAERAQNDHETALAGARRGFGVYADRMQVDRICRRDAAPAGKGTDPGVPFGVPADTGMVAISRTDLQDLVDWLAFGVAAHNAAVDKINDGTGVIVLPKPEFGR